MNIVVVEDNIADIALLEEFLEDRKDAPNVHFSRDGEEAWQYLQRHAHDVEMVLLDLGLPKKNGYELLRQMRDEPVLKDIPVVVLSTSRNPADMEKAKTFGANGFISKPHNLKGYEILVESLIDGELLKKSA